MSTPGITVVGDNTPKSLIGTPGDDAFAGTSASEYFRTGGGNDWLFAGGGSDHVYADLGNDWLEGGDGSDTLYFNLLNFTTDVTAATNFRNVTFDLAKSINDLGYLGKKTTYGFENVTSGSGNDKLYGTSGANNFDGGVGNDYIDGRTGDDTLLGNLGSDTLVGGTGRDVLCGYYIPLTFSDGSRDYYRYSSTSQSSTTQSKADHIYGYFEGSDGDKIDLSRIDANGSASGNGTFKIPGGSSLPYQQHGRGADTPHCQQRRILCAGRYRQGSRRRNVVLCA